MLHIKSIFKACVCSFCKNIYEYDSIDVEDFMKSLEYFITKDDLDNCLEVCTSDVIYDIKNIDNICDNSFEYKYKRLVLDDIMDNCRDAFMYTLNVDKTINVEAFVNNLFNELTKKV